MSALPVDRDLTTPSTPAASSVSAVEAVEAGLPVARVVFDVDGTLAVGSSAHLTALSVAVEQVLGVAARFDMHGERPLLNGVPVAGWVDRQCFGLLAAQARVDWGAVAPQVLPAYEDTYLDLLDRGASAGRLLPGVRTMLERLREAGIPVGLSTGNASTIAQAKLAALGIADFFTFDAAAGFGDRHLNRDAVAAAAFIALPQARRSVLVGDTIADVVAARTVGATALAVTTGAASAHELIGAGATALLAGADEVDAYLGLRPGRWFPRPVPGSVGLLDR